VANVVARRLVIAPHRNGGQAQFLESPVDRHERGLLSGALERARRRLDQPITLTDMAGWASTSPRTLIRRVRAATGMTPGDWMTHQRIARAKELLEQTMIDAEELAARCGFGTASTLRHHFRKRLGLSPSEYRRRFTLRSKRGAELR
jgi:AraC family transcriptional activator FtrA